MGTTPLWTAEAMMVLIPLIGTTLATMIISILNWKKQNQIHTLVNSGKTQMLREILGIRLHIAKLSGKDSDALLAEEALKNLEESDTANKKANKEK